MMRLLVFLFISCLTVSGISGCTSGSGSSDVDDELSAIDDSGNEEFDSSDSSEDEFEDEFGEEEVEDEIAAQEEPAQEEATQEEPAEEAAEIEGDDLEQELAEEPPVVESEEIAPTPEIIEPSRARVQGIRYLSNAAGGTVVIETSEPVAYQTRMNNSTGQFVIELANVELPQEFQRSIVPEKASSRIGGINAYQSPGSATARVVVQLIGKLSGAPVVQQEGTSLVVVPPAPPAVIAQVETQSDAQVEVSATPEGPLAARTLADFLTGAPKFYGRRISLQVKDADIRDVINFLSEESGSNIVMSDEVKGNISVKLRQVPWDQALVMIMKTRNLGYVRQGRVLRISSLELLQKEAEATEKVIESQQKIEPPVVQVIPVNYALMEDLIKAMTPFLGKEGKIAADPRTNTLIVTDQAAAVDRVKTLVKTLDIPPTQVSIEAKIVEALETFSRTIGVNWSMGNSAIDLGMTNSLGAPIELTPTLSGRSLTDEYLKGSPFTMGLSVGTLDFFGDLTAALSLAEVDETAKVISAPRISAMNRQKSTITQADENISVVTTITGTTNAVQKSEKRTPFSLELSVTPQITGDGGVIMDVDVKREFLGPEVDPEFKARPIRKRAANTRILVRNGQTAVIGGIYSSDEVEGTRGVPGLKNIPVIGWLFKAKTTSRFKNELLIFLTPRILSQNENDLRTSSL